MMIDRCLVLAGKLLLLSATLSCLGSATAGPSDTENKGVEYRIDQALDEAVSTLAEAASHLSDEMARYVLSTGDQLLEYVGSREMYGMRGAYSPRYWGQLKSRETFGPKINQATYRIVSEPDERRLVATLVNMGQPELHLLLMSPKHKADVARRLKGLVEDNPILADRLIELLRERRSMLEIVTSEGLNEPISEFIQRLDGERLPAQYFSGFAGLHVGTDVLISVLEVLPMRLRIEILEEIGKSGELAHLRDWLEFWVGHLRTSFWRDLMIKDDWFRSQVEAGRHWWLKELANLLESHVQREKMEGSVGDEWTEIRELMLEREPGLWWLRLDSEEIIEGNREYLSRWMSELSPELKLEVITISRDAKFARFAGEIHQGVMSDIRETDCEPPPEQVETLLLLSMALIGLDTEDSVHLLSELVQWMSECSKVHWHSFVVNRLQYDTKSKNAANLMAEVLADNPDYPIVNLGVLTRLSEVPSYTRARILRPRVVIWLDQISRKMASGDPFLTNSWNVCGPLSGLLVSHGFRVFDGWENFYRSVWQRGADYSVPKGCEMILSQAAVVDEEGRGILGLLALWDDIDAEIWWYSSLVVDAVAADGPEGSERRKAMLDYLESGPIWDQLSNERKQLLTGEKQIEWD